jgi:hypothetical protein
MKARRALKNARSELGPVGPSDAAAKDRQDVGGVDGAFAKRFAIKIGA